MIQLNTENAAYSASLSAVGVEPIPLGSSYNDNYMAMLIEQCHMH